MTLSTPKFNPVDAEITAFIENDGEWDDQDGFIQPFSEYTVDVYPVNEGGVGSAMSDSVKTDEYGEFYLNFIRS